MNAPPFTPPLTELLNADISFITPDKNFGALDPKPAVNLFLYDVKENRDLRDPTPILEKVGSSFVRRQPPVRIDCSYIVTAWPDKDATNEVKVVEEHRLLAQALLWLTRFPAIPAQYLQGSLTTQPYPLLMWTAQIDPNKNAGEFWDALAIPPRAAFYLTVTIAMELGLSDSGPLVTTRSTQATPDPNQPLETLVQIGGRILGPEVNVVRVERNLVNAAANQATLPNAADAAQFLKGDIVLLKQNATEEQASVQNIAGATLTLETNLVNNFNGGTIRIADFPAGGRQLRVDDTKGINPGNSIRITQAADVEEHTVEAVDRLRSVLTFGEGLVTRHDMLATSPPIKVAGIVGNALIEVIDAGLQTQSDQDGRYTFPRVPVGTRNVQVLATGFQPKNQSVVVPGPSENYEITLTPLP